MQDHNCKDEGHSKYDQPAGQTQFLFNVSAVDGKEQTIHVAEGEMDALVLSEVLGEPVVGVPGVDHWHDHWPAHFAGFGRIVLWQQGDKAGRTMGSLWGRKLGAELVELPTGHDVNSYYLEVGDAGIRQLNGGDDENLADHD
jgi:hypothetical protein